MKLAKNERLEDLQCDGLKIIQNKELYCFTSDSIILANYVRTKQSDNAVEIGAGSGVISILVQAKNKVGHITAFEMQAAMADLCKKNININKLENKIAAVCDKVQNFEKHIKKESVDVVYSNPPYFKETNFTQNDIKKMAKEEICLPLKDLVTCASQMLRNGGEFYCCYGAERSVELLAECQKQNLAIKEMFYTENGKGEVKLVIFKAVKGGKNGVKVLPNLVTNEKDGTYLEQLKTKNFK